MSAKKHTSISIQEATEGLYQQRLTWWLRWTPVPGGGQKRVSLGTRDLQEAIAKAAEYRARQAPVARAEAAACAAEIDQYIAAITRKGLSPATVEVRGYVLHDFAATLGAATPRHLRPAAIQTWCDKIWDGDPEKGSEGNPYTAEAYLNYVRWWMDWLVDQGRLGKNVAREVKLRELPMRKRRPFLPPREARLLLDTPKENYLQFVIYCGLQHGMRKLEIIEAPVWFFDLETGLIHIEKTPNFNPKTRECRTIPMTTEFRRWMIEVYCVRPPFLAPVLSANPTAEEFSEAARSPALWTNQKGRRNDYMLKPEVEKGADKYRFNFRTAYENLIEDLALGVTFHDLRRTFASLLVSSGVSIYKVAKWLGDTVKVVEGTYGHLIPQDDQINDAWK